MVERGGLENRCARKRTVGSNPTPSAKLRYIFQKLAVLFGADDFTILAAASESDHPNSVTDRGYWGKDYHRHEPAINIFCNFG